MSRGNKRKNRTENTEVHHSNMAYHFPYITPFHQVTVSHCLDLKVQTQTLHIESAVLHNVNLEHTVRLKT